MLGWVGNWKVDEVLITSTCNVRGTGITGTLDGMGG